MMFGVVQSHLGISAAHISFTIGWFLHMLLLGQSRNNYVEKVKVFIGQ